MDNGAPWSSRSNWTIHESHCLCFVSGARAEKTDQIQLADEEQPVTAQWHPVVAPSGRASILTRRFTDIEGSKIAVSTTRQKKFRSFSVALYAVHMSDKARLKHITVAVAAMACISLGPIRVLMLEGKLQATRSQVQSAVVGRCRLSILRPVLRTP